MSGRISRRIAFFASLILIPAALSASTPNQTMADDNSEGLKAEIAKVVMLNVTGFMTRNLEMIMSAYSPNENLVVFDITPPLKYVGAKALRALNERWLREFTGKIEGSYTDLNVTRVGDVVYGYNIQHWKFTRPDGSIFAFTTRLSNVYRRFDGHWRTVLEHGSLPVDLASEKAVLDAK